MAHVSSRRLVSPHLLPFGSCRPRASTRPSSGSRGSLVWPTCRIRRMAHVVCLLRLLGITLGLLRRFSTRPREPDTWARGWLWRLTWSASPSVGGELTWRTWSTCPRELDTWARGWLWRLTWSASPSFGGELTWRTWSTSDFFYRPARPTCRIRRMVHVENSNQQAS